MHGKAEFLVEGAGSFMCQFNPKELKLEDTALWKASDENGKPVPLITYERGEAATLSMELIFDTTDGGGSVQRHIDSFRGMQDATIPNDAAGGPAMRPPYVTFVWGNFSFEGVCEKISSSALMFRSDGTAIRAKIMVTLKEKQPEGSGNSVGGGVWGVVSPVGTMFAGGRSPARQVNVQAGETLTQVAARAGSDARDMAIANNISDMTDLNGITDLVVPAGPEMAPILGAAMQGNVPQNFQGAPRTDPFGGGGLSGIIGNLTGDNPEISAAFSAAGLDPAIALVDQAAERAHEVVGDLRESLGEEGNALLDKVGLGDHSDKLDEKLDELADDGHDEINDVHDDARAVLGADPIDRGEE